MKFNKLLNFKIEVFKLVRISYLLSCLFLIGSSLTGQEKSLKIDSLPKTDIYCIGNVHFDGIYYRKNKAFLDEVAKNEKRESDLFETLISKGGVTSILLEYPVHDELFLNYFISAEHSGIIEFLDTTKTPAYTYTIRRLRRLVNQYTELSLVCVDRAEEKHRFDFMNTLLFAIFSQYRPLEYHFLFPESVDYDTYLLVWNEYYSIIDSLSKEGCDSEYIQLLHDALEVRFYKSCRKRKVRQFVEELKIFYLDKHPELATPFITRMCNSYISKRTKQQKLKREHFIFNEVTQALVANDSTPVLLQIGKWHIQADTENNLRYLLENPTYECTYLKLYQPIYHFWYTEAENDLEKKVENGEVVEVGPNDYLLF